MSGKRPLEGNLVGLFAFAQQWTAICKRLIPVKIQQLRERVKNKEKLPKDEAIPDLAYAPKGHFGAIVTIQSGAAFVTIAKRAIENKCLFEPSPFIEAVLEAELEPFGTKPADLCSGGRSRATNRNAMSIYRLMQTFVFFDLFKPANNGYRITDLGVSIYEELSKDPEEQPVAAMDAGDGLQFMGRYSGLGTASGGYTQVTLHRYY